MAKKTQRQDVHCVLNVDTDRLYGPIGEAAKYLDLVARANPDKNLSLAEVWTGYENMHLEFQYVRKETDDELNQRLKAERDERRRKAVEDGRKAQRKAIDDEIKALERKRGLIR